MVPVQLQQPDNQGYEVMMKAYGAGNKRDATRAKLNGSLNRTPNENQVDQVEFQGQSKNG